MSEHQNHEPPAEYRYAVGAGLGLLAGCVVGIATDDFILWAILGVLTGLVLAFLVKVIKP